VAVVKMGTDAKIALSNRDVESSHGKVFLPRSNLFGFPWANNNQRGTRRSRPGADQFEAVLV
jgi:hypothetical protein